MKLNELPKTFWTDTRADALERQKATMLTQDFRRKLKDLNASHSKYALTISTNQSSITKQVSGLILMLEPNFAAKSTSRLFIELAAP